MRNSGFTLVEMLLVLAIVGILVTIILPSVVGVTMDTKEKQAKADLRLIQAAIGQYYVRYNTFPTTQADPDDETWINELLAMSPRVINKRPGDPFRVADDPDNPPPYQYEFYSPAANEIPTYVVWSVGISGAGAATADSSDHVTVTNDVIYVTNSSQATTN